MTQTQRALLLLDGTTDVESTVGTYDLSAHMIKVMIIKFSTIHVSPQLCHESLDLGVFPHVQESTLNMYRPASLKCT